MKNIYIIGGTMGVGKSTVSKILKEKLNNSIFLDGDWCWDAHPFQVTEETKRKVLQNICFLLNQFIHCSAYQNIVFCWVLHEQSIIERSIARIPCYTTLDTLKINTNGKNPLQIADKIILL